MSRDLTQGFLRDIVDNPTDDTPRLVYADWLEDNGDLPRAEFIRVQLDRARLPKWDAGHVRLKAREEVLLAQHGAAWRAELPTWKGVEWGDSRRGFVAQVRFASFATLRAENWRQAAPIEAVSVRWPKRGETDGLDAIPGLRELKLTQQLNAHADAERLAASPLLTTLRVLDVTRCATGLNGLWRLIASPHLGCLEVLRAGDNSIGDGIANVLGAVPALHSLEELDLSESGDAGYYGDQVFTEAGLADLGAWPGMARLRRLDLSGHDCRRNQLAALLRAPLIAGLKELTLHNTHNYDGWGALLDQAASGLDLESLDISGNNFRGDAGVLADNPRLSNLKMLRVQDIINPDATDDLRDLVSGRFMASLRVLHLPGGEGTTDALQPLLDVAPPLLHTLSLSKAYLCDAALLDLTRSPASDTLHELDLTDSQLGPADAAALGASAHLRSLLVLRVGDNRLSEDVLNGLAASPLGRRLLLLDRTDRRRR